MQTLIRSHFDEYRMPERQSKRVSGRFGNTLRSDFNDDFRHDPNNLFEECGISYMDAFVGYLLYEGFEVSV